ncbi:sugar phosphate isomerase/epimerase, partial [Kitasatospora sp. NPDC001225]
MPLALASLGLPGTPLDRAAALAAEHGWHGLELRCADDQPVWVGVEVDRPAVPGAHHVEDVEVAHPLALQRAE